MNIIFSFSHVSTRRQYHFSLTITRNPRPWGRKQLIFHVNTTCNCWRERFSFNIVLIFFKDWALMMKCSLFLIQKQRLWTLSGLQPWTHVWRQRPTLCAESVSADCFKRQTCPALLWSYPDENRSSHSFGLWNSWTILQSAPDILHCWLTLPECRNSIIVHCSW